MVRVFPIGSGDRGFTPVRVIPKIQKWYWMLPCLTLSIIRYGWRVKWNNPGKGVASPLHIGVVAIEKGAFRLLYLPLPPTRQDLIQGQWPEGRIIEGSLRITLDYGRQLYYFKSNLTDRLCDILVKDFCFLPFSLHLLNFDFFYDIKITIIICFQKTAFDILK